VEAGHQVSLIVTKGDAFKNFRFQISDFRFMEVKTGEDITKEKLESVIRPGLALARPGLFKPFSHQPSVIILAAFGPPFLPAEVLNWPKYGCLNVHASLLPRWRGASPVFGAIANGDQETGVSIMRMTEEIDRGSVLGQERTVLSLRGRSSLENRESLTRRLGILGGELIVETLENIENGQIIEVKQPQKSPTPYTRRLTKDTGRIDWRFRSGETDLERSRRIERFIRAVTPWPGAITSAKFKVPARLRMDEVQAGGQSSKWQTIPDLKILQAHLELSPASLSHRPNQQLITNNQQLIIDLVQLPGKNPISWKQFLTGHPGAKFTHGPRKSKSISR